MENIFLLLYLFDIPGYDIDGINEFSLRNVTSLGNCEYAIDFCFNNARFILFSSDCIVCNRYYAERIDMKDKLKFIKPKGVKDEYLVNGDGEESYYVRSDLPLDFGGGSYLLAKLSR